MSSPPWEADRPLTLEGAREAIATRFPEIDSGEVEPLGSGWEFDAFRTADDWVFRFPRRASCEKLFESERRVHRLVSPVLPKRIAIPRTELCGEATNGFPYRFAGHRFIPGVPADALRPGLKQTLAGDLARALGAIHSIPEADARRAGVEEFKLDEGRLGWLERGVRHAAQLHGLDPGIDPALEWAARVTLPPPEYHGPLRFLHHDLTPDHLIADPASGRLVGILDWNDAILGDPARDFVVLAVLNGWESVELALATYPIQADGGFRRRVRYSARLLSVIWLANAEVHGWDLRKPLAWVRTAFADDPQAHSM